MAGQGKQRHLASMPMHHYPPTVLSSLLGKNCYGSLAKGRQNVVLVQYHQDATCLFPGIKRSSIPGKMPPLSKYLQ